MTTTYTPPTDPNEFEFPPSPPVWPKVIGILSIVWASIGLLCTGCGLGLMPLWTGMMEPMFKGDPPPPSMTLGVVDYVLGGVGLLVVVLLLCAGIATVMRRPAGRTLHLVYGAVSIPLVAANLWNTMQKNAATAQWLKDYPNNDFAKSQAGGGAAFGELIGYVMIIIFGLAWPVFCLIWFGLVKRRAADFGGVEALPEE